VAARASAVVAIENQSQNFGRLRDAQRFFEELTGRSVSRYHDEKTVHPSSDDATIGDRYEWRGVENDVVISPARLRQ